MFPCELHAGAVRLLLRCYMRASCSAPQISISPNCDTHRQQVLLLPHPQDRARPPAHGDPCRRSRRPGAGRAARGHRYRDGGPCRPGPAPRPSHRRRRRSSSIGRSSSRRRGRKCRGAAAEVSFGVRCVPTLYAQHALCPLCFLQPRTYWTRSLNCLNRTRRLLHTHARGLMLQAHANF